MAAKCTGSAVGCLLLAGLLLVAGRELKQEEEDCIGKCVAGSIEDFPLCYAGCPHGTVEEGGAGNNVRTTDCMSCCREYEGDESERKRCVITCSWKRLVEESGARSIVRAMDCAAHCLRYEGDERKGCVIACKWELRVAGGWEKTVAKVLPAV
ncbi:hypothetical protein TRIUR3_26043 [Triticum urartu]|uniref:Uncharacterized protein n=1 Tax=Triticum urartu TaxID=4572 RepID=M8A1N6_TRIUA|nr:hypothetical protein TRIUR3_26043 [Triticum urartu]